MKRARRYWPSAGFVFMLASYGSLIAFFAWGAATPELDRAWHVLEGMKRDGFAGLLPAEEKLLRTELRRYPDFAPALVGRAPVGWVEPSDGGWMALRRPHVVIQAKPAQPLRISAECRAPRSAYPVTVRFVAAELHQVLRFERDSRQSFDLPVGQPAEALWVEVELDSMNPAGTPGPEIRLFADTASAPKAAP